MPINWIDHHKTKSFISGNRYYLIINKDNKTRICDFTCPHRGGPLIFSKEKDNLIVCPWHKNSYVCKSFYSKELPTVTINNKVMVILNEKKFRSIDNS
jgi:nitrite reductase/ring-hydroxylating ferredoxin subunit